MKNTGNLTMNHFTKEELEELRKCFCLSEQMYGHTEDRKNVRLKLNLMIDKYCEHQLYECDHFNFKVCSKCDTVIGKL